jgi:hypothetical protein
MFHGSQQENERISIYFLYGKTFRQSYVDLFVYGPVLFDKNI